VQLHRHYCQLWASAFLDKFSASFPKRFRQLLGLLGGRGWGKSPMLGLYLHRRALHRKKQTYIHTSSGIRTHDPSVRADITHVLDGAVIMNGTVLALTLYNLIFCNKTAFWLSRNISYSLFLLFGRRIDPYQVMNLREVTERRNCGHRPWVEGKSNQRPRCYSGPRSHAL
jgi:hypothetical protein